MSLCFVANKDLTVPYSDIAKQLKQQGERIFWLVPSRRWARWLRGEGWPADDIVCLADHIAEWEGLTVKESMAELADIESEAPATISNIIWMCRNLRRSPARFSYAYLAVVRRHVEPLLLSRGVEVVFGEATWGFELLIWLVCHHHGIPMVMPVTARLPADRFYFANSMTTEMLPVMATETTDREWAADFLRTWLDRPLQPAYMQAHRQGYQAFRMRWIREMLVGVLRPDLDRGDATLWPLRARIADRITRIVNAWAIALLRPFQAGPAAERYVLYPLHHQPEQSIDVFGSLNSNQTALIETISRLLPATHVLWVKEHKGAISDRSIGWYRWLRSLPNVRLIDPFEDIFRLIRGADLVVTIAGTVAYEAALLGVPNLGLAPVFFASLLDNRPTARSHPLEWRMRELLNSPRPLANSLEPNPTAIEFLAQVHANSYLGDPLQLEAPIERRSASDYLAREARAFSSFLTALRETRVKVR